LLGRFSERLAARKQARALLELMWAGVALNWYPPAERLAGPNSRTYDYLTNDGILEHSLALHGWRSAEPRGSHALLSALGGWAPPESLRSDRERYPRTIRASWGNRPRDARTHVVHEDVALGTSSAPYHAMDMPLTVDLPGDGRVRGYFIPDGRNDPYGTKEYDIGSGHTKARHLRPFWTAAQRGNDAIGLCVYHLRGNDPVELPTRKSHFVFPADVDAIHVGGQRIDPPRCTSPRSTAGPARSACGCGSAAAWRRTRNSRHGAGVLRMPGVRPRFPGMS
jgi:hypothetical protein